MSVLGCAETYTAAFHDRTGAVPAGTEIEPAQVSWGRESDATSEAVVTLPADDPECCGAVAGVHPWCNDLTLYRDGEMVWQGPVVRVATGATTVVTARDVTAWLARRVIHRAMDFTGGGTDLAEIAAALVRDALEPDDPGVLAFLEVLASGVAGERAYEPAASYAYDELRELARVGVDFTAVGHRIIISGEGPLARLATLTDEHFAPAPTVIADGLSAVTRAVVHGAGVTGQAGGEGACGLLEHLAKEDQITGQAEADAEARALVEAGYPTPLILDVPDGAQLTPDAPVLINHLVPGVTVPVAVTDLCRPLAADLRLVKLAVTFDDGGEQVKVTLAPRGTDTVDLAAA